MSSLAVFSLKCPSLLSFEKTFQISQTRSDNLKRLFRLERVPSDTQLREVLDYVNYEQYRSVFKDLFSYVQRSKALEKFVFMDIDNIPHYAVAVDGTGIFRSEKIKCPDCLVFERIDADNKSTITYGHNMLAASLVVPGLKQVIPFCPEAIVTQDGKTKNDSEITAFKRFIKDFQKDVIKDKLIHVDFQQISMDETISITVPIKLIGDAPGVREGGVLQQLMREVDIEVLPINIPHEIELDISELTLSDSLEVGGLEVPEEVKLINSLEDVIVTVVAPSEEIEEEEEEELEEEFIEPEVIGEEDEEGEEGEEGEEENLEDKDYYQN
jgi:large subunit ribosomal protein L25